MSERRTELVQATAVAIAGRALMIEGPPGSGKSSLALALIDRGAMLVGDDGVELAREGNRIIARPAPNIAGKLEIRNVGIVDLPSCEAPLSLILSLEDDAARHVEEPDMRDVLGVALPALGFTPGSIAPAIRAEWALAAHGLAFADTGTE